MRVLQLLQRASSADPSTDTEAASQRKEFELDVTESAPTGDQMRSILEYVGAQRAGELVKGAKGEAEAMRRVLDSGESFVRPVVSLGSVRCCCWGEWGGVKVWG